MGGRQTSLRRGLVSTRKLAWCRHWRHREVRKSPRVLCWMQIFDVVQQVNSAGKHILPGSILSTGRSCCMVNLRWTPCGFGMVFLSDELNNSNFLMPEHRDSLRISSRHTQNKHMKK